MAPESQESLLARLTARANRAVEIAERLKRVNGYKGFDNVDWSDKQAIFDAGRRILAHHLQSELESLLAPDTAPRPEPIHVEDCAIDPCYDGIASGSAEAGNSQ